MDRGRVGIYWVLQTIAALFALALVFATLFVPFAPISWQIDPARVPAGVGYTVIYNTTRPAAYIHCPSMTAWLGGERPGHCHEAVHSMTVSVALAGAGALVAIVAFVFLRRARLREKYRARDWVTPTEPVLEYRQSGMPGVFWLAFALVGALTALLTAGAVTTLASGASTGLGGVGFYGAILIDIVWVHGFRRAYGTSLDGAELHWTTPLRSQVLPLATVAEVRVPGTEGVGEIETHQGQVLRVNLPDAYRSWQFRLFCDTLRDRGVHVTSSD